MDSARSRAWDLSLLGLAAAVVLLLAGVLMLAGAVLYALMLVFTGLLCCLLYVIAGGLVLLFRRAAGTAARAVCMLLAWLATAPVFSLLDELAGSGPPGFQLYAAAWLWPLPAVLALATGLVVWQLRFRAEQEQV